MVRARALWSMVKAHDLASNWLMEKLEAATATIPSLPAGYADPAMQSLVMLDDGEIQLSVAMVDAVQWQVASTAARQRHDLVDFGEGWTWLRFLTAGRLKAQIVRRSADGIRADPPISIAAGQEFHLANTSELLRLLAMDEDIAILRLLIRDPQQHYAYEFDAQSGALLRTRQARSHEARTQITLSLLRALERKETLAAIADGLPDWPPELRWHAVREALVIDSRAGFALLEGLISGDPDPRVRELATQTRVRLLASHPDLASDR